MFALEVSSIESDLPAVASQHPWVIYTFAGLAVLSVLFTFIRRESGNWGQWLASQRRVAEERGDIVVAGLKKDLAEMRLRSEEKDARLQEQMVEARTLRSERDALVNYLREWWNWALAGPVGAPPPVPDALSELLPAAAWTWRDQYRAPQADTPVNPPLEDPLGSKED